MEYLDAGLDGMTARSGSIQVNLNREKEMPGNKHDTIRLTPNPRKPVDYYFNRLDPPWGTQSGAAAFII